MITRVITGFKRKTGHWTEHDTWTEINYPIRKVTPYINWDLMLLRCPTAKHVFRGQNFILISSINS
jgi:hypothetical protein